MGKGDDGKGKDPTAVAEQPLSTRGFSIRNRSREPRAEQLRLPEYVPSAGQTILPWEPPRSAYRSMSPAYDHSAVADHTNYGKPKGHQGPRNALGKANDWHDWQSGMIGMMDDWHDWQSGGTSSDNSWWHWGWQEHPRHQFFDGS